MAKNVLGSARSTDLPHLPFGSVSLRVLHLARRPVIVVPKEAAVATAQVHPKAQASEALAVG